MKHFFILFSLLFLFSPAPAQRNAHRRVISAHIGVNQYDFIDFKESYIGKKDSNMPVSYIRFEGNSSPTFQLAFDYGMQKRFSIGMSAAYHTMTLGFTGLNYKSDIVIAGNGGINQSHISVQFRPLYHFLLRKKVDMYFGLSAGVGIWTARGSGIFNNEQAKIVANNLKLLKDDPFSFFSGSGLPSFIDHPIRLKGTGMVSQFSVTLFGLQTYLSKHWGAGLEFNTGNPYYVSGGINYRF